MVVLKATFLGNQPLYLRHAREQTLRSCTFECFMFAEREAVILQKCALRRSSYVHGLVLFTIHHLRMRSFKNDRENWSGQNRTSRTACYGHEIRYWSKFLKFIGSMFWQWVNNATDPATAAKLDLNREVIRTIWMTSRMATTNANEKSNQKQTTHDSRSKYFKVPPKYLDPQCSKR